MSTSVPIIDTAGQEVGVADFDAAWLEREKGEQAVHDTVVAFLAGLRSGSACTKNRAKVHGTGAKPWRQKGTGRARAGSVKSPIWRGGGVVFGPAPRSYAKRVNRKVQMLALRRAFTERVDAGDVIVVDELSVAEPKTRCFVELLAAVGAGEDALVVVDDVAGDVQLASRNLPGVEMMKATSVNPYWMLLFSKIVVTRAALDRLGSRLSGEKVK
ncbi:MAG: 50S ribosomal protein L4 [Lentisphaerae bacterium]|jgi:large subunit ribosomal protein L4|nr:50S ribosomal protein L4 [Lentisphaerota bacterium]MBT4822971.1 50S ribosomal protein L4 [Lentisphaerota bacterium]MBT5609435.1 50S ribosomal protein L4 [Lentisphaerota bacterium]MBT7061244.1 50S ribosomal protein L4 [Lentisphaerota bacterium]MBT7848703.1 50S ribosomal protein L4 [Lentisphaerota bacterium]